MISARTLPTIWRRCTLVSFPRVSIQGRVVFAHYQPYYSARTYSQGLHNQGAKEQEPHVATNHPQTDMIPTSTAPTPSFLESLSDMIPDWISTCWGWALLMAALAGLFGRRITFLQYSSGSRLEVKLRWITPRHLKRTIMRESQNFQSPICTDVMWSFHNARRVDFRVYDPLLMIPVLREDTIGFGSEAEFRASMRNTSKREMYSIGVGNIEMIDVSNYIYLKVNIETPNSSVMSHIQWFYNNKPLVDDGSNINGSTTRVLVLDPQSVPAGGEYKVKVSTPGYIDDIRSVMVWRKEGKIFAK